MTLIETAERSLDKRVIKEPREKQPTPGTQDWFTRLREDHPEWYEDEGDLDGQP